MECTGRAGLRLPRALSLAVTGLCNLSCRHCLVEAGPRADPHHVPADAIRRIVGEFAALGGEELWLTGGEPLLHPQWLDILSACCRGPSLRTVGVQTNGALLGGAQVGALRALRFEGLRIQVSLDGSAPRTHDRVRGRGSFERTLDGVRRLVAAGLGGHISVAFTEMRHNMDDLPALLALVEALGVRRVVSGTLLAQGRAAKGELAPPTPAQYRALLSRYHADGRFQQLYAEHGEVAAIEWWKGRAEAGPDCCTLGEHPYVTADGTVYPCALCRVDELAVRGAFERPLAATLAEAMPPWSRLLEVKQRRHGSLRPCLECSGRLHCGGGCMGRAHAATGDLMAVEDRCELRKAVYGWREDDGPRAGRDPAAVLRPCARRSHPTR
ncbi:radical SAM protein [Anaeromyxobacter oryzae]|uniref:Radical SAM protein n=2 Tax=Anaeromyxobacter oryzae TaxID=2918170 RepID=A0ABM7X197_9BACT|nr:radical SAM protein [Anaeromyxobacter oryzae]